MTTHSIRERVYDHLSRVYPDRTDELDTLTTRVLDAAGVTSEAASAGSTFEASNLPGADEIVLITYGDTFLGRGQPHLQSLAAFWNEHFAAVFSTVHVLPFFPSSSDGGFSVVDYREIDPALGEWSDLAAITSGDLMVDLVCNHGSVQSAWFADFIADVGPGRDFYLTADPEADLGMVTRPRTHSLLLPVETAAGTRHVWATFSHDQVDFDFTNPDVLVEFCAILGHYLSHGATRVRLDAIAYLWKQIGTACVHLPETHQVIKLMRALVQARDPKVLLITETNVPHAQNVSYFGDGDEAHAVYNFTLAPLIVWSLITGRSDVLTRWMADLAPPPRGCTFLNFVASHDGIGVRPVEDLISADELAPLLESAVAAGGSHSSYSSPDGLRPYEINVSLADLLAGAEGETMQRFVVAHALMLAAQGIPAIYVHSMLATAGDRSTVMRTGHNRDVNRARLSLADAQSQIATGWRSEVLAALSHLIKTRSGHPAFAPGSPQTIHDLHPQVMTIERGSGADRVLALHNMSDQPVQVESPASFGTHDILTGDDLEPEVTLAPWQARWLI